MVLLFNDCVGARGDSDSNILAGYKKTKKKTKSKPCRKRKLKKCKHRNIEEFVNQRFSELATPKLLLVENTLAAYSKTLDPERVVRLVKLIHELHEPKPPMKRLLIPARKKKKKRRKCKKLSKEEEKRRWLEKQSTETAKLIICFLKNYINYTPNYKQLHVSLELVKQLKFKKRKDLSRMTKAELNKICQKLAVICDTKFEPYKRVVKTESIKSETTIAEEDKKHCIFSMKDFEFDFESTEEEFEEEEKEEEGESEGEGEGEGEEEEEEEGEGEEFEEYVDELTKLIEEEVAALEGFEAEGEVDTAGKGVAGDGAAETEGAGEGGEGGEGADEAGEAKQEQIGDVGGEEDGEGGESDEEEVGDFGDGMGIADDKTEVDETAEEDEGEVGLLEAEWDQTVEAAIEDLEGEGSVTVSLEEEEEFGVAAGFEEELEMGEEEEEIPLEEEIPKEVEVKPHPEGTVSFVSWSMYSSWLNEFGKNINMYSSCLQQFRYTLQRGTVAKHNESIKMVLTNWSKYLGDVKKVDEKMVMYFKNKPITRCDKCLEYDMTNIPKDHDIPVELLDAVKTTATWKKLLSDAEKHCKAIGTAEEPQVDAVSASTETIEILKIGSSTTSGFFIEDKD